jgi:hypothetical protein
MKSNRVLAVGENHGLNEPQEKLLTAVMGKLKESGATHLAVEISDEHQPALDRFMSTGTLDSSLPWHILNYPVYIEMLKAARRQGLQLVAVDMQHPPNTLAPERDAYMAHKIDQVLSASPDNKVIFLTGERHIDDFTAMGQPPTEQSTAVSYLRDKYDVASVGYEKVDKHGWGLRSAFSDLQNPTAVSSTRAPLIANHQDLSWLPKKLFDYTIFYPANS